MNKLLTLWALCIFSATCFALTVTTADYGFAAGKIRNYRQGSWNASATDLSEGTGKYWSFTTPTTGYMNNSYITVQNVPAFPTANVASSYTQYVNGILDSGTLYYQHTDEEIYNLGYAATPNLVWNPAIPMGLPHYLGKTWQGTHQWTYGSYSISGKVISEGTVSFGLGSFPAVCVRYHYATNSISYDNYQWETAEYGIVAYSLTINGGTIYVLNQAEPNVANDDPLLIPLSLDADISPNPFRNKIVVTPKSQVNEETKLVLYNLRGQKLFEQVYPPQSSKNMEIDLSAQSANLRCGVYLLSMEMGGKRTLRKLTRLP